MLPRILFLLIAPFLATIIASTADAQATATAADQPQRFAALEKSLTGVTLVGFFTDSNDEADSLKAEQYELQNVRHVGDNHWMFLARIKYGEHDVTLPLTLPVRWAGDTPVVSIDKFTIPGLGTYTARVMFYADHYAGFWSGADHGGHLFGIIERGKKSAEEVERVKE